jgi:hypothetical protein
MLQALSDLFLLLSNDTKKITNKDLIVFYNFIIKKIPQIEQQFPSIISKSLTNNNIPSDLSSDKQIDINEYRVNKDNNTKKLFIHFQKQIFNLFSELIIFCFREGIIKINDIIIQENILTKVGLNSSKVKFDPQNDKETQKFLIHSVIHNKVNCTIYPSDYIKFFNSENSSKKRICAERFMKFIKHMIIIYKESKKHANIKRVVNTEKKVSNTERIFGYNNRQIDNKDKLTFKKIKKFEFKNSSKDNSSSDKSIIMNNGVDYSLEDDNEEINDTIKSNTLKNINKKFLIKKIDKMPNKINNKSTMAVIHSNNNILNKNNLNEKNSKLSENQNQKKKFKFTKRIYRNKVQNTDKSIINVESENKNTSTNNTQNLLNNYNCYIKSKNNNKNSNNTNDKNENDLIGCNIN